MDQAVSLRKQHWQSCTAHLTGNLNYYLGAEMGGTGYVRNRPLEFEPASRISKAELLARFDEAIAVVAAVLAKQAEGDWGSSYSAKGLEEIGDRFSMVLQCAAHLYHHTGQIMYLCKELERQGKSEMTAEISGGSERL